MEAKVNLKALYLQEIAKAWGNNKSMMDYFDKKVSSVIQLSDGKLIAFDKEKIKTDFCFGYNYGIIYDEAIDQANKAMQSEVMFKHYNLEKYNDLLFDLKECLDDDCIAQLYLQRISYTGEKEPMNLYKFCCYAPSHVEEYKEHYKDITLASKEDAETIYKAVVNEREKMEKRLNTYLKRYGLSKLHIWTYDRND